MGVVIAVSGGESDGSDGDCGSDVVGDNNAVAVMLVSDCGNGHGDDGCGDGGGFT